MVQINFGQREVSCKVVFYGPGMSGKTTNLEIIHKKAPKDAVGEMVSIATETDRTLYFDFLPLDLGQVAGMRTKFQLYTVPGQIYYNATRKLVLQGVDGVIFVADSNPDKMAENLESFQNLRDNLAEMGLTVDDVPVVLQYNKRDLPNALSVADLDAQMNPSKFPTYEACAREGKGVFATLKEISRLVIEKLNKEHAPAANRRRTANNLTPAQPQPAIPAPLAPAPSAPPAALPTATPAQPPRPAPPAPMQRAAQAMAPTPGPRPALPNPPQPLAPIGPQRPVPPNPAANRKSAEPAPQGMADDPKNRHLLKAKPPSLDQRGNGPAPDVGSTDPDLRKYQTQSAGGGGLLKVLLIIIILVVVLIALVLFIEPIRDAVRPLFPSGIQRLLLDDEPGALAASPTSPASVPAPAPASAVKPATPAVVPAGETKAANGQ